MTSGTIIDKYLLIHNGDRRKAPQMVFEYICKRMVDPVNDPTIDQSISFGPTAAVFTAVLGLRGLIEFEIFLPQPLKWEEGGGMSLWNRILAKCTPIHGPQLQKKLSGSLAPGGNPKLAQCHPERSGLCNSHSLKKLLVSFPPFCWNGG